ncbi:MAG TPA: glycosyltransferase family 2 protein [Bacillota bacterium]|nr:glycosyltransferase family 2 protein [Bacillota bacterium]
MTVILWAFGVAVALELLMEWVRPVWRLRKWLAPVCMLLTAFASGGIALWRPNVFSVLIGFIGLYRVFNYLRLVEARMHERYLYLATRRTGLVLLGLQAAVGAGWLAWERWHESGSVWTLATLVMLGAAAALLASTLRSLNRTAWPQISGHLSDQELPTVSVAIPARNETEDLEQCLQSVIASDYPKLEILVLDDCSQIKRTPEIIRSFAHDGVRFVQGDEPSDTWLPKNQAYDKLVREASGEYIVFAGVDVRFGRDSLRQLMTLLIRKNKVMASILPWRHEQAERRFALPQAMRYFWELMPPRRLFNRPPVLSTCLVIKKEAVTHAGGFVAVARSITPEAFFARKLIATDGYSFMRASLASGIESSKASREQLETAVRTRYPQLHRRPENVVLLSLLMTGALLLPFVLAIGGFWLPIGGLAQALAALACALLIAAYWLMTTATRTGSRWFGLVGLPLGVMYDIGMQHYSMWQYEFSTVEWKGRNVCIPAMHVIPHLPKLND